MIAPNLVMAELGALLGDPARANILAALMDGRALPAGELAYVAGVAPQTASGHLARLTGANLLALEKQGRHRYYRLASPLVASMLEGIMAVAAIQLPARRQPWSRMDDRMRAARTCYDHIAGCVGVGIADTLAARGHVTFADDGAEITEAGTAFLAAFGIAPEMGKHARRAFCRPCLDWSERRPHIAGAVGAALLDRCLRLGWFEQSRDTRALTVMPAGQRGLAETFGLQVSITTLPTLRRIASAASAAGASSNLKTSRTSGRTAPLR
jgi:DNA-binding transcriptional ArsR family regulator